MAFASYRTGAFNDPRQIFVMNADGTERRNLTADTNLRFNSNPTWSPDGRKIAFDSRRIVADRTRTHIFVITADGIELEQLTDGPASDWTPVYSPDGTKIAFESNRHGGDNIYVMDTNGKNAVNLTRTPPGVDNTRPSWPHGALAITPNGKLPISWGELKRADNP